MTALNCLKRLHHPALSNHKTQFNSQLTQKLSTMNAHTHATYTQRPRWLQWQDRAVYVNNERASTRRQLSRLVMRRSTITFVHSDIHTFIQSFVQLHMTNRRSRMHFICQFRKPNSAGDRRQIEVLWFIFGFSHTNWPGHIWVLECQGHKRGLQNEKQISKESEKQSAHDC